MKPLGIKAYGSIPHLPGSRLGPGDHTINPGQARLCTEGGKGRRVYVQEKIDGSCVAVLRQGNELICLNRKGYDIRTGDNLNHLLFRDFINHPRRTEALLAMLNDGERLVGEWIARVHGTKYPMGWPDWDEPFFAFDIMRGHDRLILDEFDDRNLASFEATGWYIQTPRVVYDEEIGPELAWNILKENIVDGIDQGWCGEYEPEGLIYRVEHGSKVDFLAKWVRSDFDPGKCCQDGQEIWQGVSMEDVERVRQEMKR